MAFAALRSAALAKVPEFIEKYEPQMEEAIKSALGTMKQHPEETTIFLSNWKKLDSIVRSELEPSSTAIVPIETAGRRKRTKRTQRIKGNKRR
jgi:hypothetical protein